MPIELTGAAADVPALRQMATKLDDALEDRIRAVTVVFKTAAGMPKRSDGGPSFGYWKSGLDQIWLWEEIDEYSADRTLAHEAMHVVDSDWLTRQQRLQIIALMDPAPVSWGDKKIHGINREYKALPFEAFAVYASAPVAGLERPAYRSLFLRSIKESKWPDLRAITLDDGGAADRVPEVLENLGIPEGTEVEGGEEPAGTRSELAAALAARDAAQIAQALAEGKLAQAKTKAGEIGVALSAGDVLTATEKVAEIQAL